MDVFHKADRKHLKLIFPFLEYRDILSLLCSSRLIYDSLIFETRQITISCKGLLKLLQDPSFILGKIEDASQQLSVVFEDEGEDKEDEDEDEEALLQSVKPFFPYFFLTPEVYFPSLQKLSCVPIFFIYLCEMYPGFTVRKLEILKDLNESIAVYLSPHIGRVSEDLILRSWPSEVAFPQLSPALRTLSVRRSTLSSLLPPPNLKYLRVEECVNIDFDLRPYNLEILELFYPSVADFALINGCKRLVVHSPEEVKNLTKAKQFEQIEFREIDIKDLPLETLQSVRDLNLAYSELDNPVSINLSSFTTLERFELEGCDSEDEDALITLYVDEIAPSSLKIVKFYNFANTVNLSWFSNVREIGLEYCNQVTSLLGLEKVPRVTLRHLPLESLEGLGGNAYVEVSDCESLEDFSALKHVKEVKIEECVGFVNAGDVGYVEKLSIIGCVELEDLSDLMEVKELYLDHCDNVINSASLDKIPKLSIHHCKKLKRSNMISLDDYDFGLRDLGFKDGLSSLPDSLHLEILKYLQDSQVRSMISCNSHFYQRYSKTSFKTDDTLYRIVDEKIKRKHLQIPSSVKVICCESCTFTCSPNFPKGLKQLEFDNCHGMKKITDFCEAEEVIIGPVDSDVDDSDDSEDGGNDDHDDIVDLVPLNRIKRLTLDSQEKIEDYSPLQDNEEITVMHYLGSNDATFKARKAFSNTKKVKLYFEFPMDIEIDLSFYQKLEVFDLSGGNFQYNGPFPSTLRKLYLSRLRKLTLPSGLDHLHLLHIAACRKFTSLQGVGSIPNIRLSTLPDLKSLEGLGPGNEFVQLLYLDEVEDFSAVSGCRKVVIWGCGKFKDASAFAESNYVVIGECGNLVDVSMLGKVKHLELIGCKNIWSLKGLEGVKELIVSDCRLLENQNNTRHRAWTVLPEPPDNSYY